MSTSVTPAQLSFLAIYNPSLGTTDETFEDQIVFWYSKTSKLHHHKAKKDAARQEQLHEEENEKLRQIGLAQGMVDFARSFANGQAVEHVETEKSRIVLRELEGGWWILASIDLTRLPIIASPSQSKSTKAELANTEPVYEYSSREVSPPALLIQQLVRAHGIFLLHNGPALVYLFNRLERSKFCNLLDRFWNRFAQNWDVLLHGNPAVDISGGLKLSAGGELGIGVGEEEWGSGEREVLEDFAGRTEGLVDLVVSRFGEPSEAQLSTPKNTGGSVVSKRKADDETAFPWMGATHYADAVDGIFFSGVGAISRSSLRDISHWTEWIYAYGDHAYGVKDNPSSDRRKRKRKPPVQNLNGHPDKSKAKANKIVASPEIPLPTPPGIPPPIVSAVERSLERATSSHDIKKAAPTTKQSDGSAVTDTAVWMKYLTLGYGSSWGGSGRPTATLKRELSSNLTEAGDETAVPHEESTMRHIDPDPDIDSEAEYESRLKTQIELEESGHFIVGLKGDLEADDEPERPDSDGEIQQADLNQRILLRTLYVELTEKAMEKKGEDSNQATPLSASQVSNLRGLVRLRVIIYVHRPFIYTFLFHPRTSSLQMPAFYRNLHTFFAPLHRPLSQSTSPSRVAARIRAASTPYTTTAPKPGEEQQNQPIFDIVYDPRSLAVHASVPNIPIPGTHAAEGLLSGGWSRVEALNVHSAILEIWRGTRGDGNVGEERELERSVKTGRGWWVVWMRLDDDTKSQTKFTEDNADASLGKSVRSSSRNTERGNDQGYFNQPTRNSNTSDTQKFVDDGREAILVRRARDAIPTATSNVKTTSGLWGFGGSAYDASSNAKDAGAGWGPARLAEGVGVDARKYVQGLLSLNR